jgi:hypothetical protein
MLMQFSEQKSTSLILFPAPIQTQQFKGAPVINIHTQAICEHSATYRIFQHIPKHSKDSVAVCKVWFYCIFLSQPTLKLVLEVISLSISAPYQSVNQRTISVCQSVHHIILSISTPYQSVNQCTIPACQLAHRISLSISAPYQSVIQHTISVRQISAPNQSVNQHTISDHISLSVNQHTISDHISLSISTPYQTTYQTLTVPTVKYTKHSYNKQKQDATPDTHICTCQQHYSLQAGHKQQYPTSVLHHTNCQTDFNVF